MIDRANADARIADGYWQDEIIGALYRRGIVTWRELSKHDFNSIASWSPKLRWALESFKEELEARGLDLLPFDAFALLTNGTKNALAAAGITSLAGVQRMSHSELRALKGVGSQTISDIEECCRLANLVLRPETSGHEPLSPELIAVESDWATGVPIKTTAERLGVPASRISTLRRKLTAATRQRGWARHENEKWRTQQALFGGGPSRR